MLEIEVRLLRQLRDYADALIGDVPADRFAHQAVPGMNPPAWILGHLAYALDRHATFVGATQQLASWQAAFGKGSSPSAEPSTIPPRDEIVAAWRGAVDRMVAAVEAADPARLAEPNPGPLPDAFPTVADFLAYSMTTHTATHLGQLSAWRRAMGNAALY